MTKMAGIEISEEITNDQLEAMTGGELLRQEVRQGEFWDWLTGEFWDWLTGEFWDWLTD